jgi:hypothetical protein
MKFSVHKVDLWVALPKSKVRKVQLLVNGMLADFSERRIRGKPSWHGINATEYDLGAGYFAFSNPHLIRVTDDRVATPLLGDLKGIGSPKVINRAAFEAFNSLEPTSALLMWRDGHWTVRLSYKKSSTHGKPKTLPARKHNKSTSLSTGRRVAPTRPRLPPVVFPDGTLYFGPSMSSGRKPKVKKPTVKSRDKRSFKQILWANDKRAILRKEAAIKKFLRAKYRENRPLRAVIISGGAIETNRRKH